MSPEELPGPWTVIEVTWNAEMPDGLPTIFCNEIGKHSGSTCWVSLQSGLHMPKRWGHIALAEDIVSYRVL